MHIARRHLASQPLLPIDPPTPTHSRTSSPSSPIGPPTPTTTHTQTQARARVSPPQQGLPSDPPTLVYILGFHGSIAFVLLLLVWYWIKLTLVQTLVPLAAVSTTTMLCWRQLSTAVPFVKRHDKTD
jgi:hypothetical protein